jgi:dihydrofolate reductase
MAASTVAATPPRIVLVAAVAENGVIGRDNALPWRLSSDLRHFRAVTMGKPVIMGRNTYLSIGKPLPGRTNIVVSRDPAFAAAGVVRANRLVTALQIAHGDVLRRGGDDIAVIGGGELFAQTMTMADRLEITLVHTLSSGTVLFPPIDPARWRAVARHEQVAGPNDDADMTFITYEPVG